jgi:hypothetical protein
MSMTKEQYEGVVTVGSAAKFISDNATAILGPMGALQPELREHMNTIDLEVGAALMGEVAEVMYEAACRHLTVKGLVCPPFRPDIFMNMEAKLEEISQRDKQ